MTWSKKETHYLCTRFRRKAIFIDNLEGEVGRKKFYHSLVGLSELSTFAVRFERKAINDGLRPRLDTTFFDLMQQPKILLPPGRRSSPPSGVDVKRFQRVNTHQTLTMESLILAQDER